AVLRRPVDAHPPIGGELRLPPAAPLDLVGERREARGQVEVGAQPLAHFAGERLLLSRETQIHIYGCASAPLLPLAGARSIRVARSASMAALPLRMSQIPKAVALVLLEGVEELTFGGG